MTPMLTTQSYGTKKTAGMPPHARCNKLNLLLKTLRKLITECQNKTLPEYQVKVNFFSIYFGIDISINILCLLRVGQCLGHQAFQLLLTHHYSPG